ncbi:MAG: ectoine/hydroxyectoine ABC transporter ATP-binding protein EhuA, partial [Solirubrobacterales bacterium]|nr:ectoine/hydroxyectoine ABC transporter ATP-binding protein EhuA [Solirubrobacterales bacterium]
MSDACELRVEGLHASYGDVPVLDDVTLQVNAGEVVSVV